MGLISAFTSGTNQWPAIKQSSRATRRRELANDGAVRRVTRVKHRLIVRSAAVVSDGSGLSSGAMSPPLRRASCAHTVLITLWGVGWAVRLAQPESEGDASMYGRDNRAHLVVASHQ